MATILDINVIASPSTPLNATPTPNAQQLCREAHARGLSPLVSRSPEQVMPMSPAMRIGGLIGACMVTMIIFAIVAALIGSTP